MPDAATAAEIGTILDELMDHLTTLQSRQSEDDRSTLELMGP